MTTQSEELVEQARALSQAEPPDHAAALPLLQRAAELGHGPAMENLGYCYREGLGCEENQDDALYWYEKAADSGQPAAAYHVASILEEQRQEYDETIVAWYRRSAEAGYHQAQYAMGYHYEWGYAVELNTEAALEWYRLAAAQGNEDAIESVQYLLEDAGLADS